MESSITMPTLVSPGTEEGAPATNENPSVIGDRKTNGGSGPPSGNQLATDASTSDDPRKEDETLRLARLVPHAFVDCFSSELCRLLADALKSSVAELRKDEEVRMSQ